VVPLILAYRNLGKRIVGLEIQTELVELAKRNVQVNGFGERILIHEEDFRRIPSAFRPGSFTLVLSNPPYRRLCSGRVNPQGQQAVARHELKSSVADVFKAASALLAHGGRLAIIYPAARLPYLLTTARDFHLTPKELTIIHSRAGSEGRLVHLECRKGAGEELRITPPFVIYEEGRRYSEAMRLLYEGRQERETEVV
jgi:tRNA1Val (adenine37-N6)-methyltransferase